MRGLGVTSCFFFAIQLWTGAAHAAPPQVQRLGEPGELAGLPCDRCSAGDFLVDNGRFIAVFGASHRRDESFYKFPTADALGGLVFLRATGADVPGDFMLGTPWVRTEHATRHIVYDDVAIQVEGELVHVAASGEWRSGERTHLRFEARYAIAAGSDRVDLSLTATNVGAEAIEDLVWSVFFDPHQVYDFAPADHASHGGLAFRGYPRASQLVGWIDRTRRVSTESDFEWGWDGGMIVPDPLPVALAPGAGETRTYSLVVAGEPRTVLRQVYRELGVPSVPVAFDFASKSNEYFELVVREAESAALFYRSFLDRPSPLAIELPEGRYVAEARFFPGTARCSFEAKGQGAECRLDDPPRGRVTVRVVDAQGRAVPGKVTFRGVEAMPAPFFRPVNPAYDDGYWESAKNSVFPLFSELDVELPAGSYRASASRGPEYSIDERDLRIVADESQALTLTIDRVIDRPDLVSMDTHLHTLESDGAVTVAEKIRAIVAEGIDVAIATDHNLPVDYRPALAQLGLQDELLVAAGAEVTVPERLDYNSYPMTVRPARHDAAINPLATDRDLGALFEVSRARDDEVILQVNHPRSWRYDYFNWHGLDPESAAFATEGFDLTFDVLEVVNGAIYERADNRAALNDWFNLLRRGHFRPLVGTSDSHEIDQDEPGYSRTWIYRGEDNSDKDNGGGLTIAQLMAQVRAGHSFASNGPVLDLSVAGRYGPGDTFTSKRSRVPVVIDVRSAPWIEIDRVRLYVNGVPRDVPATRLAGMPAFHWRAEVALDLGADSFLVAEVTGAKELGPVVQRRVAADGSETPVTPYALTNPVFVDRDGNGRFDPPLSARIEILAR